jgi:hypothetical protein
MSLKSATVKMPCMRKFMATAENIQAIHNFGDKKNCSICL